MIPLHVAGPTLHPAPSTPPPSLLNPCSVLFIPFQDSLKAGFWIRPGWLMLPPDLLFHDETRKKSFWESPSLTFMGNLLAHLAFSPHQHRRKNSWFSTADPPIHPAAHGCFGKSLLMGSSSALCWLNTLLLPPPPREHIHYILGAAWA